MMSSRNSFVILFIIALLLSTAYSLNLSEYRAVVFYSNGTQKVYKDVLIVNSSESYGANISYMNRSFYVPSSGEFSFILPKNPFNIAVFLKPEGERIAFIIQNNYSYFLNLSLRMEETAAVPTCGSFCVNVTLQNKSILANFSIPPKSSGVLFLSDVRTIGNSYMKFKLYSLAEVNRTVPINVVVEKSALDNRTYRAKFRVINIDNVDALAKIRAWFVVNNTNHLLYNGTAFIPAKSHWEIVKTVESSEVPVFYLSSKAFNSSYIKVAVKPAYPDNITNPTAYIYGEALVMTNITEMKRISIISSVATPKTVRRYETVNFIIDVKNTGFLSTDVTPIIEIYLDGTLIRKIELSSRILSPGENITIMTNYIADIPPGTYRVVFKILYDNRTKAVYKEGTLTVFPPRAGEEIGRISEFVIETEHIKFLMFPALIEVRPGETKVVSFEIENPTNAYIGNLRLTLEGLPEEWVTYERERISLKPKESLGLDLVIEVPLSALPGDYKAVMRLNNTREEAKVFFILRIKPYPPKLEKPAVLRNVYLSMKEEKSIVRVFVENTGIKADLIEVLEEIPKDIAENIKYVTFKTPVEIIEEDPVILWRIRDADPFDVYVLDYEVKGIEDRYDPYVYWPIKQVNVLYEKLKALKKLRFRGITAAYAYPGEEFEVKFRVVNPSLEALNLTFTINIPENWEISPKSITKLLLPGYTEEVTFKITPAEDAEPGSYTVSIRAILGNEEISHPMTVVILEKRNVLKKHYKKIILILGACLVAYLSLIAYRRRRIYRREIVDAVKKIREKMEEE